MAKREYTLECESCGHKGYLGFNRSKIPHCKLCGGIMTEINRLIMDTPERFCDTCGKKLSAHNKKKWCYTCREKRRKVGK